MSFIFIFLSYCYTYVFMEVFIFFDQHFLCIDVNMLQEDVPDEFATIVLNFISRNWIGPNGVEVGQYFTYIWPLTRFFFSKSWQVLGLCGQSCKLFIEYSS